MESPSGLGRGVGSQLSLVEGPAGWEVKDLRELTPAMRPWASFTAAVVLREAPRINRAARLIPTENTAEEERRRVLGYRDRA